MIYLCLVASNKQQIQWTKLRRNSQELWITGNSKAGADSYNHEIVIAMKRAWIVQYWASDAVPWLEENYAQQQYTIYTNLKNHALELFWRDSNVGNESSKKKTFCMVRFLNTFKVCHLIALRPKSHHQIFCTISCINVFGAITSRHYFLAQLLPDGSIWVFPQTNCRNYSMYFFFSL